MWKELIDLNSIEDVKIVMILKEQFFLDVLKIDDSDFDVA